MHPRGCQDHLIYFLSTNDVIKPYASIDPREVQETPRQKVLTAKHYAFTRSNSHPLPRVKQAISVCSPCKPLIENRAGQTGTLSRGSYLTNRCVSTRLSHSEAKPGKPVRFRTKSFPRAILVHSQCESSFGR